MALSHSLKLGCLVAAVTLGCGTTPLPGTLGMDATIDLPPAGDVQFPTFPDSPAVTTDGVVTDAAGVDGSTMDGSTDAAPGDAIDVVSPTVDLGGDAGTPAFCGFTHTQMNSLAILIAVCTNTPPQTVLTNFYDPRQWEGGPFQARPCSVLQCALEASSCSDVLGHCLKYSATPQPDGGTCAGFVPGCSGTDNAYATSCANGTVLGNDCQAISERCVSTTTQSACAPTRGDPCSLEGMTRCNGTVLEACVSSVFVQQADCSLTASRCDPTMGACVGTGVSCSGTAATCNGTSLVVCRGGLQQTLDCGALVSDATCQRVGSSAFCGVGTACDPTTATPAGQCTPDNMLQLCAGGQMINFACVTCDTNGCAL